MTAIWQIILLLMAVYHVLVGGAMIVRSAARITAADRAMADRPVTTFFLLFIFYIFTFIFILFLVI